jgi:D-alanyl-D-alanine carboxypeptidase/D-alanyl-D-alanine-endopeptidase (penicillin-binding protein 4)
MAALLALVFTGGPAMADEDSGPDFRKKRKNLSSMKSKLTPEEAAIKELKTQLTAVWSGANLRIGTTAIHVVDADTGESLYSVHGDQALNPASNVKLISTGTVLATLGPDWRYQTRVLGSEPNDEGIVSSGLYLFGNYDPTLGPGALTSLAKKLYAQGVRTVAGDIVLSADSKRDTVATSRVRVTVTGGGKGRAANINVWPETDLVQINSNKVRKRKRGRSRVKLKTRIEERDGLPTLVGLDVQGTIRAGQKRVLYAKVPNHSEMTADLFKNALEDAGIEILGTTKTASFEDFNAEASRAGHFPWPLAFHESATIRSLVTRVNKRSLNHLADRLVMSAAQRVHGGPLRMSTAVDLMKSWLISIGVDADAVVLDTGSGLSYKTRLSTEQIVKVLRHAGGYSAPQEQSPSTQSFRDSLSISGIDGTLRRRFRDKKVSLHRRMHGKTGTLTSVIALSGFLTREDGRTICFSIVSNGHPKHFKRTVRQEHEHLVAKIDTFLDKGNQAGAPGLASKVRPPLVPLAIVAPEAVTSPAPEVLAVECMPGTLHGNTTTVRLPPAP